MKAVQRTLGAFLLASAICVCALAGPPAADAFHREPSPEAAAAIRAANADWLPAMRRADAAAVAAPYAEDGLFIGVDGTVTRGREAIRNLYAARLATIERVVGGELKSDGSVQVDAALVYEWGHATLVVSKKDGSRAESGGGYLTVWRRNLAGRWEIIRNIVF